MTLTPKQQIIIIVVTLATGVAFGRYLTPQKIKIETKTVEIEKKSSKTDDKTKVHKHKDTTTTTTKKSDGTVETTTKVSEDTDTGKDVKIVDNGQTSSTNESKTEKTSNTGHLNLSVLAGANPFNLTTRPGLVYGAHLTRDVFGPLNIGIWGLSDGTCGMSVGLSF